MFAPQETGKLIDKSPYLSKYGSRISIYACEEFNAGVHMKVISDHRSEFPILSNWNEEA